MYDIVSNILLWTTCAMMWCNLLWMLHCCVKCILNCLNSNLNLLCQMLCLNSVLTAWVYAIHICKPEILCMSCTYFNFSSKKFRFCVYILISDFLQKSSDFVCISWNQISSDLVVWFLSEILDEMQSEFPLKLTYEMQSRFCLAMTLFSL